MRINLVEKKKCIIKQTLQTLSAERIVRVQKKKKKCHVIEKTKCYIDNWRGGCVSNTQNNFSYVSEKNINKSLASPVYYEPKRPGFVWSLCFISGPGSGLSNFLRFYKVLTFFFFSHFNVVSSSDAWWCTCTSWHDIAGSKICFCTWCCWTPILWKYNSPKIHRFMLKIFFVFVCHRIKIGEMRERSR